MNSFAVGIGGDEIEESKQHVLIGPELLEGQARRFGGFPNFEVTVERLLDHAQ